MPAAVPPSRTHDWAGEDGERWVTNQPLLDRMLLPFGEAAIAAARPQAGEAVLDIGCGAGATSMALASAVNPGGHVLGLDISPGLIALATRLAAGDPALAFRLGDAAVVPLAEGGFDLLFSRFGVMFFADPLAAFHHLRHAVRPGGRLAFVCWRAAEENDWVTVPAAAIAGLAPPSPPPPADAPGPFAFARRERIAAILGDAGFGGVEVQPIDAPILMGLGDDDAAALDQAARLAAETGPVARAIRDQPEAVLRQAVAAVRRALEPYTKDGRVTLSGACWVVTASR